ncbi:DUF4124 domain-containing protein [Massilia antarctica]|uniref:DUF4124 domain-containing protein n=1 Tax=Massilia antarctica TaxID=2765360 RepID=UPI0006BC38F3|nr:DUF4124 domain-containing protein [Massilia sp. H27-R4]MCY0912434.1 DUF4124 domain-containing protein [Massilia sp. H27-R4]CUI03387.1 PROBABLE TRANSMEMBRANE PROTEIN [Janthinobacterium sp. CG23_2]CUU27173.1 PROBABLE TRANSMEMBRANE PROTEIN [Janthinobacterium sp. CG23_2]
MVNLIGKRTLQLLAGGALMLFATVASAQYVWVDANGTKQFSDRPPPPGVPAKNILKSPSSAAVAPRVDSVPAPASQPMSADDKVPPSLADREADYRKRTKAKEDEQKKTTAEATRKANNKIACESARTYKRNLEQGTRVSSTDKNGERTFMDDSKRASEIARANKTISDGCK